MDEIMNDEKMWIAFSIWLYKHGRTWNEIPGDLVKYSAPSSKVSQFVKAARGKID